MVSKRESARVVWCGVVWCGVVWCGVVWCGVVWCGVVWCGVVWCGVVWCGVVVCACVRACVQVRVRVCAFMANVTLPSSKCIPKLLFWH